MIFIFTQQFHKTQLLYMPTIIVNFLGHSRDNSWLFAQLMLYLTFYRARIFPLWFTLLFFLVFFSPKKIYIYTTMQSLFDQVFLMLHIPTYILYILQPTIVLDLYFITIYWRRQGVKRTHACIHKRNFVGSLVCD